MKKCLFFIPLLFFCVKTFSQTVPPNTRMMQVNTVKGSALSLVELSENFAYHIGTSNSSEIGFDGLSAVTLGLDDLYILKSDINGGSNVWFKTFNAGNKGVITPRYSYVDAAENLYVFGQFKGTIMVGSKSITSADLKNAFLIKIDSEGNALWITYLENGYDALYKTKCVADEFDTFIIFNNKLARLNSEDGTLYYEKFFGCELKSVAINATNLYVAGAATFSNAVLGSEFINYKSGFIVKGSKNADFTESISTVNNSSSSVDASSVDEIAFTNDGKLLLTGFNVNRISLFAKNVTFNYTYNPNATFVSNKLYYYTAKTDADLSTIDFFRTSSPFNEGFSQPLRFDTFSSKLISTPSGFKHLLYINNRFYKNLNSFINANSSTTTVSYDSRLNYSLLLSNDINGNFLEGIQPLNYGFKTNTSGNNYSLTDQYARLFTTNIYNSQSGGLLWSKQKETSIGGTLSKQYHKHLNSMKNDLFVTSAVEGKVNYFGQQISNTEGSYSRYITRLGSDGLAKWFAHFSPAEALDELNYSNDYACVDDNDHLIFLANTKGTSSSFIDASGSSTNFQQPSTVSAKTIIKIDKNGIFRWGKQLIPAEPAVIKASVTADALGNVFVVGTSTKNFTVDGSTVSVSGQTSIFILKFSDSGTLLYAKAYQNLGAYSLHPVVDNQNNLYVFTEPIRHLSGDYLFDGVSIPVSNDNALDHLMLKFNEAGNVIFGKNFYKNSDITNQTYSWPNDVQFDGSDFIVMGDYFRERTTIDFVGLDMAPIPKIYETGSYIPFLAKVKTDGTVLWQKPLHVNNPITGAYTNIDLDEDKNIYMTWNAKDKVSYNGTEYLFDAQIGNKLLTKIDTGGNLKYFKKIDVNTTFYPVTDVIGNDKVNVSGFTLSNEILNYPVAYNRASSLYIATFGNLDSYYLTPTKEYLTLAEIGMPNNPDNANTFSFDLINNTDWNAVSDQSWLNLSFLSLTEKYNFKNSISGSGDAKIIIAADTNNTGTNRSANLIVGGTGVDSTTIIVTQTTVLTTGETKTWVTTLYPNPTSDILNIETKQKISKIEIYDLSGKLLKSENGKDNTISVSQLRKGMYLIKLYTENGVVNSKFIKN